MTQRFANSIGQKRAGSEVLGDVSAGIITGGVGAGGDPFLPASWEYGV